MYRCGPLVDLCRGPHIPNTSFVKAFSCLKVICLPLTVGGFSLYTDIVGPLEIVYSFVCLSEIRLHQRIGEVTKTVKACKEYMEYLLRTKNALR